ncbi:MAG: ribonuclease D [Alphaproteobacteria bacterium]|nr:ribonuclease D [Alphaproteobacteria bacterium]
MSLISDNKVIAGACQRLAKETYITVDTEFMRDRTYWPRLCLIQLGGAKEAVAIDALAKGVDLAPLYGLMANSKVLKVFHAARQDVEIFFYKGGAVPAPLFDTQIAAMVCGFGDAVAYDTLVAKLAKQRIDKSSRFTDWSHRPLSKRQLDYALADVIHLRTVYEKLLKRVNGSGRMDWLEAEMSVLIDPATYALDPREAWRRIKIRSAKPRMLAVLRELAAWRETEAQRRDLPRNRVLRDEALLEIAASTPGTGKELARTRGLSSSVAQGSQGRAILAAVKRGLDLPEADWPSLPRKPERPSGLGPVVDLLKVLLKMKCEAHGVAQKLVASADDLERIAADDRADVPALAGWRREIFGEDALALKHGRIGLTVAGKKLKPVPVGRCRAGGRE